MKTLITTCLCSLAFALVLLAQAPPPAQAPPATGGTSPGAQAPTNPAAAAQQPGAPGQQPPVTNLPPGQQPPPPGEPGAVGQPPAGQVPAVGQPGAPGAVTSPAAAGAISPAAAATSSSDYRTRSGKARWCFGQQLVNRPVSQRRSGDVAHSRRFNRSPHRCARAMHLVEWPLVPAGSETDRESFHRD